MTTTTILIRHGAHDLLGRRLAGRMPGVPLNTLGHRQALQLRERLIRWPIVAVYAGPLQRVQETAAPLAAYLGLPTRTDDAFDEIDTGRWTGLTFDQLNEDGAWSRWNSQRGWTRCPGGESFGEVQVRVARGLERLTECHSNETVAVVTHGDIIKAAVAYALGLALDSHDRFDIEPASLSVLVQGEWGMKLLRLNDHEPQ